MERVKALLQQAFALRNLALTFRDQETRQRLEDLATQCEQIAKDRQALVSRGITPE